MSDLVLSDVPAVPPGEAGSGLEIRLFGSIEVRIGSQPLPRLRTRKALWLLALLALRAGRGVERQWLAETLWPDADAADARRSLRQSLHDLRLALGPAAERVASEGPRMLRLDVSGAFVDVLAFDAAVACGNTAEWDAGSLGSLEAAVRLYRGPLLEECAEEWILEERRRREQSYVAALERLATAAAARAEHEVAASYLRQAISVDPYREELQRALMEALAAVGSPAGALVVYRELRALLGREMAAEPSEQTTALFRRLRDETRAHARTRPDTPTPRHPVPPSFPRPLPLLLTELIGREEAVREVMAYLDDARLVTLTGTGGIGKTRLALQVAHELTGEYEDGVGFVDLAPLTDPERVPDAVRVALGIPPGDARQEPIETVRQFLSSRRLLLVLDNCEHLLDGCATLAEALLSQCAGVCLLATSRQPLGIHGEWVWQVPALSLPAADWTAMVDGPWLMVDDRTPPDIDHQPSTISHQPSTLLQYAAVRLFLERVHAAGVSFEMTPRNAPAIVEVVRRLDGIPLAIELAAARVRAMPVEQIAARLDDRFQLLTGGSRTALPRQQTLRATMDWTYGLLSEPERVLMRRLSVFAGGWTLEAAEAVCRDEGIGYWVLGIGDGASGPIPNTQHPIPTCEVLDLLTRLVEKSLVVYEAGEPGGRYRSLETVRQYFTERLLEAEEGDTTRGRHLEYFLALAEEAEPQLRGAQQREWLERLEGEHDNLRAALAFSSSASAARISDRSDEVRLRGGSADRVEAAPLPQTAAILHERERVIHTATAEKGLRLAGAVWRFWSVRGYLSEGRQRLAQALASAPGAIAGRAKALEIAGWLAYRQGDYQNARSLQEESLAISRESGDRAGIAASLRNLGLLAHQQGDLVAARWLQEESLGISRDLGNQWEIAASLYNIGGIARKQGEYGTARSLFEESLAIRRGLGDRAGIAASLRDLGSVAYQQGEYAAARSLYEESLGICRELGDRLGIAGALHDLGEVAYMQGEYETARSLCEERLAIYRGLPHRVGIAGSLCYLGSIAYQQGEHGTARSLHEESLAIFREVGDQRGIASSLHNLARVTHGQGDYQVARVLYEQCLAIRRALGDRHGSAYVLLDLGNIALKEKDYKAARALDEEGLAILRELGDRLGIAASLEALAELACAGQGQPDADEGDGTEGGFPEVAAAGPARAGWRAARLLGAAEALREAIGAPVPPDAQAAYRRAVSRVREMLGEEAFAAVWAEGRALSLDQVIAYALERD